MWNSAKNVLAYNFPLKYLAKRKSHEHDCFKTESISFLKYSCVIYKSFLQKIYKDAAEDNTFVLHA